MLDLAFVRANLPLVEEKLRARGADPAAILGDFKALDESRRAAVTESESLRAAQKKISEQVGLAKRNGEDATALMAESTALKDKVEALAAGLEASDAALRTILEQIPNLEAVVVPIGGGGLIAGVACAIKESNPHICVIGVQTERLPSMLRAADAGSPVTISAEATIADGIAVRRAGERTLPLVQRYVDELVTVDEEEIAKAILVLLEREKTLAEGAGAVALASLLQHKTTLRGQRTAVLVCGGNIDVSLLARIIERGLVKDGRRTRLRIHLTDRPGALHQLTRILADARANIVQTAHDRAHYGVNLGDTVIDITLETRGDEHIEEIRKMLTEASYRHERID